MPTVEAAHGDELCHSGWQLTQGGLVACSEACPQVGRARHDLGLVHIPGAQLVLEVGRLGRAGSSKRLFGLAAAMHNQRFHQLEQLSPLPPTRQIRQVVGPEH